MSARDEWQLLPASQDDIDELMTWFPDKRSVDIWGGPHFRYPFTRESFLEDCRIDKMATYKLLDPAGEFVAFGQIYKRLGRINLARLIAKQGRRGEGIGKKLVTMLMQEGASFLPLEEFSLYVYRDNTPAYECYKSVGFEVQEYPEVDPLADVCYYLTRPVAEYRDRNDDYTRES